MRQLTNVGKKPTTNVEHKALLKALFNAGYNCRDLCKALNISSKNWLVYFSDPRLFTMGQMQHISYLLNKPLGEVINLAFNYKPGSVQWVNESVNHVNLDKTH